MIADDSYVLHDCGRALTLKLMAENRVIRPPGWLVPFLSTMIRIRIPYVICHFHVGGTSMRSLAYRNIQFHLGVLDRGGPEMQSSFPLVRQKKSYITAQYLQGDRSIDSVGQNWWSLSASCYTDSASGRPTHREGCHARQLAGFRKTIEIIATGVGPAVSSKQKMTQLDDRPRTV